MHLQSIIDEESHSSPFNLHQAFTLLQMGPKTVKVLVHEKNKDILGLNYETIKKAHEQMIANQQEKKKGAASKDGKVKLPKHYEPKGLIWSINDFI